MAKPDYLGEFEFLVLLALMQLGDDAYGVSVRQEIASRTGRDTSIGAIYTTLTRLEEKGYVRSRMGDPTPERGGRSKRFFRITNSGTAAVRRTCLSARNMLAGLNVIRRFA